ncbi:MAG: prepilin-type N-terminal cleavage/methylation domain-containing protein [Cytophagales bacterium]|nr:prepilin-type N-terminal cleavage/methylation domain-containing protein [Armatimonadota bacterium]
MSSAFPPHPVSAKRRRGGFTLIELLVVIAIIAILAAILFPVFASARVRGHQITCVSNMRQLGTAFLLYTDDNDGAFPFNSHYPSPAYADSKLSWRVTLDGYLKSREVLVCPTDPRNSERLKATGGSSYVMNSYVSSIPVYGSFGQVRSPALFLETVPRPSEMLTFVEFISQDGRNNDQWSNDHTHEWLAIWSEFLVDVDPARHKVGASLIPKFGVKYDKEQRLRDGSANYLYLDSHVRSLKPLQIKAYFDQRIDIQKPAAS